MSVDLGMSAMNAGMRQVHAPGRGTLMVMASHGGGNIDCWAVADRGFAIGAKADEFEAWGRWQ